MNIKLRLFVGNINLYEYLYVIKKKEKIKIRKK